MTCLVALYVILSIIAFIVLLFSIRFTFYLSYNEEFKVDVKWLFIKKTVLPGPEKKNDEEKPKKEKQKKEKNKPEETVNENKANKPKQDNILVKFYKNQGFSGVMQLLNDTVSAMRGMFGSVFKHLIFRELKLYLTVGAGDSAETAILYGKTCSYVFPALGFITSTCKVKDYCCDIQPNFMAKDKTAVFKTVISIRPIFITNALVVLAFKLLFKVVFKLLSNKSSEPANNSQTVSSENKQINNSQGGK